MNLSSAIANASSTLTSQASNLSVESALNNNPSHNIDTNLDSQSGSTSNNISKEALEIHKALGQKGASVYCLT